MMHIINTALLGLIEQTGTAVATLIEGLERDELLRSRLTRVEVLRQLKTLADSVGQLEPAARAEMPELDWGGWDAMRPRFSGPAGQSLDEALWLACESLVPATLLWLRVYQQSQPALFRMTAWAAPARGMRTAINTVYEVRSLLSQRQFRSAQVPQQDPA